MRTRKKKRSMLKCSSKTMSWWRNQTRFSSSAWTHRIKMVISCILARAWMSRVIGKEREDTMISMHSARNWNKDGQVSQFLVFQPRRLLVIKISNSSTKEDFTSSDSLRKSPPLASLWTLLSLKFSRDQTETLENWLARFQKLQLNRSSKSTERPSRSKSIYMTQSLRISLIIAAKSSSTLPSKSSQF